MKEEKEKQKASMKKETELKKKEGIEGKKIDVWNRMKR